MTACYDIVIIVDGEKYNINQIDMINVLLTLHIVLLLVNFDQSDCSMIWRFLFFKEFVYKALFSEAIVPPSRLL